MFKLNVILAVEKNFGIGNNGLLPWTIPEELKLFKEKTLNSVVIVGRKTCKNLPYLKDRTIICISKNYHELPSDNNLTIFFDIDIAIKEAKLLNKEIYIIGGNQIYNYVFKKYRKEIIVHISFLKNEYKCDTYFDKDNLQDFYITKETKYDEFVHCEMKYQKYGEYQYINLIKDILENGETRVGRNGEIISDFCKHLKFDLRDGFPLLTTKKMFTKGIIEELLFFIRGNTNSKILENKGINIWKGNTNRKFLDNNGFKDRKEGEMGPMYGNIWRHFNNIYDDNKIYGRRHIDPYVIEECKNNMSKKFYDHEYYFPVYPKFGIDQLQNIINEIKTNPTSRRILLTSFNPAQVSEGVLWPCHSITIQFYVHNEFLDMFCYNRSCDTALGLPFNIASSALLLEIIAKITNLIPRYFNLTLGDTHLYANHKEPILDQLVRIPYIFPKIVLPDIKNLEYIEYLTYKDFQVKEYNFYPTIKMEMIA